MSLKQALINFKKTEFASLLKHTGHYLTATLFVQAIGFISLPVMTRLLSVAEYGVLDLWRGYISVFFVVLTLNSFVAVGRYYYEEREDFNEFCGTSLIFVILMP